MELGGRHERGSILARILLPNYQTVCLWRVALWGTFGLNRDIVDVYAQRSASLVAAVVAISLHKAYASGCGTYRAYQDCHYGWLMQR